MTAPILSQRPFSSPTAVSTKPLHTQPTPLSALEHVENAGILDGVNVAQNRAVVLDSLENNIGVERTV
jgi:hypothetical protein